MREVAKRYNIDYQNIIAVGDGDNDICLIKDCGIGISFCSANPTLNFIANKIIQEKSFTPLLEFIN
ncbi:MAG: HAD hydrolase family protein [Saprospiraceae bacterium]|nr:HAD hydrolase family protein [Saprospiraceae bacterium]